WLHASAGIEGRAHPLFTYDPAAGTHWARRLNCEGNPAPDAHWPTHTVALGTDRLEDWAFTFADQAVLERAYAAHLRVVPEACAAHPDLMPIAEWLAATEDDGAHRVPTVWVMSPQGGLLRAAVSRPLALAAQDRLDFWHTLQELVGVDNAHVQAAIDRTRDDLQAAQAAELAALQAAHAAEVARVERETAQEALGRLAAALTGGAAFNLSTGASAPAPAKTPEAIAETLPAPAADPEPTAAPESAPEPPADPWIESILCTSCNDCINLNGQLFVYNGSKQAMIGDPEAGTFAELVRAAEACPSKCIHPGAPMNPNEPNLDDLIARAAKFN
ncbi:MAG: hypothetical protein KC613_09870, partial [Myxococcales bacterium]|nr:hypothetical protein [Myxococcales bacterium]